MTHPAVFFALILDGKILPVLETAKAVVTVGKIPAMYAKVVRNQKPSADDE
jgi:hypothetical protein